MPQNISVENNFTGGLKTEFTGLNFPENACTDAKNCIFTIIGDVLSREGIDFEASFVYTGINRSGKVISTYKWNNVGGDGKTQIVVVQVGNILYFFQSSSATSTNPLSATRLSSTVDISTFANLIPGHTADPSITECQFTDGNGYLFIFHPNCDPIYCTFSAGVITPTLIVLKVRDFNGIPEPGIADNIRPASLTPEHNYNLINQGWTQGNNWYATDNTTTWFTALGSVTFTVAAGITGIVNGQSVGVNSGAIGPVGSGIVTAYAGTSLTVNVTSISQPGFNLTGLFAIFPINASLIETWRAAIGNYPSNADVWWQFKNTTGTFDPTTTVNKVTIGTGPAPKGFNILNAFHQQPSAVSGVAGITPIVTTTRPSNGTWFQGRMWFTGVNASKPATGDQNYYTWTENIYFSQIITNVTQFGLCYQINDPTSENLFDLLPSDGGVIIIQGSGTVYRLFPIQNGLLVFAANGIWFITGRQGIGFTANDYTVTKISNVQTISSTSFINVLGYPIFWNEEGIYTVSPGQTGSLSVDNICVGTIASFYGNIPLQSKKFVRGDYNPVDFQVQWCFRSTNESSITDRYQYDSILVLNTVNKAFYPYALTGPPYIHDIRYVAGPGGSTSPDPIFKYLTSFPISGSYNFTFSEERDNTNFVDWRSFNGIGLPYTATFTTGYKLHGKAITKWQPIYVNLLSRMDMPTAYSIQGYWDYALANADGRSDSNRTSTLQTVFNNKPHFGMMFRRHKIRGHGYALQFKVTSVPGHPFEIMGWSILENIQQSA